MLHALELEADNLHGAFSRDLPPVLTIAPGDSVTFAVPDGAWTLESGERLVPRDPEVETGHALAGPIEVRGVRAGQILVVQVDAVRPGRIGWTLTEPPHLIRWELEGDVGRGGGRSVRLAPFLGVMGMPPPEPGFHSTHPPRRSGGNIDCKELVAGATLSCRSRSTARSSRPGTVTPPRATARSPARRSSALSRRSSPWMYVTTSSSSGRSPGLRTAG